MLQLLTQIRTQIKKKSNLSFVLAGLLIAQATFGFVYLNSTYFTKVQASTQGFYVDQAIGNDANSGSMTTPFKSIEKARDTVAAISSSMTGDIDIIISNRYQVTTPISLNSAHSGKNNFKIRYLSNPANPAVVDGAKMYDNGWQDNGNGIYRLNLGSLTEAPREIYLNGIMQTRSTSDGDGYTFSQTGAHQLKINTGQNIGNWGNLNDIELEGVAPNYWKHTIEKVSNISGTTINLVNAGGLSNGDSNFKSGHIVNIRNAFELITQNGEWYHNKSNNNLYLRSANNPNGSELAVPVTEGLFNIDGGSNIAFENLTFAYSAWNTIPNKIGIQTMGQGGVVNKNMSIGSFNQDIMDGAITMNNSQNLNFVNNRFQNLASYALSCKDGCKNQNITTNEFLNMGGGAMIYGNVNGHNAASEINTINIKNNLIKNTGVNYYGAAALSFVYGRNININHNDITEVSYSPIAIGWGWNANSNQLSDNKVTNNRIWNYLTKVFDGGAVYTLSNQPGTVISNNYIYDAKHDYGGIYPDEGSSKIKIDSNVVDTGQAFWLYIWSNDKMFDLSVTNNFVKSYTCNTNFGTYSTRLDLCEVTRGSNTTYTNNTAVTGAWSSSAQSIINNSGRQAMTNISSSSLSSQVSSSLNSLAVSSSGANNSGNLGIKGLNYNENINIDGIADNFWSQAPERAVTKDLSSNTTSITSVNDLSAKFKSLWKSDSLYLFLDITDDILTAPVSIPSYQRDGVEIVIDSNNSKNNNYDGINDCKFIFNYIGTNGSVVGPADVFNNGQSNCNSNGVVYSQGSKQGGYTLEIKIPWSALGTNPNSHNANDLIGLDMFVDDNDGGSIKESVLAFYSTTTNIYINPSLWASFVLLPWQSIASSPSSQNTNLLECNSIPSYWSGQFVNGWESSFNLQTSGKFYDSNRSLVTKEGKNTLETVFNFGSYGVNEVNIPVGGTGFKAKIFNEGVDKACFTYYQYLEPGFDFNKGGKLPGFYGGVGNTGGNVPTGSDGFSTRLMWRSNGQGQVYAYMPSSTNFGTQLGTGSWNFEPGKWQKISQYLELNTPNQNNGSVKMWIDGVEKFSVNNLNFRNSLDLKIDGILGHTFFGGNDSSWASPKTQKLWWADFDVKAIPNLLQPTPLNLKVNLQGTFNTSTNSMKTTLKTKNLIPLNQPYNNSTFNYTGTETTTASTMPSNTVDWILLEFKNTTGTIVARKAALLKSDGVAVNSDGSNLTTPSTLTTGNYQLIVRHRDHLAIATNTPLNITLGTPTTIDFTNNSNVKGSNQAMLSSGVFGLKQGNANGSNAINSQDRVAIRASSDQNNVYNSLDINMDGIISSIDRIMSRTILDGVENV